MTATSSTPSGAATEQRFRSDRAVIGYLAFLGMLMAIGIDISLPAFDEIDADLGAGGGESTIVTIYFLGAAFGQLVVGPLSDAIGRRPVVLGGLALYVAAGIACAFAPNFGLLIAARFVWGLGAAAPVGARTAISRDLYSGDKMARITTVMTAVFLLGPIFAPLIGQLILTVGSWRWLFGFAAAIGVINIGLSVMFGETLPPERRRRLDRAKFGEAMRAIANTRVTSGHVVANVFWSGAFFIFLSSSPIVFDRVYGREDQFAVMFALLGLWTIPLLLTNNKVIGAIGARRASLATASISATASVLALLYLLAIDDTPSFWMWFCWLAVASSFITLSSPAMYALALDPMGELAGTVSSLLFFSGFALGSTLAWLVSLAIETSILPFVAGFAVFSLIGLAAQIWAKPDGGSSVGAAKGASDA